MIHNEGQHSKLLVNYGGYMQLMKCRAQPLLVLGPSRIPCIALMLTANLISAIFLGLLSPYDEAYSFRIVNMVALIYLDTVWLGAGLVNPGIVTKSDSQNYSCNVCYQKQMDSNAVTVLAHCSQCGTCIEERSHHCMITGGCVGRGNQVLFYLFVLGVMIWCIVVLATVPYISYLK